MEGAKEVKSMREFKGKVHLQGMEGRLSRREEFCPQPVELLQPAIGGGGGCNGGLGENG
jgi:hypothetical protein